MTKLTIRERGPIEGGWAASLEFEDGDRYDINVRDPFTAEEEKRLEWYFEEHLRFPLINQVRAAETATSILHYGHRLFDQVFADRRAWSRYIGGGRADLSRLSLAIIGSPEFHALHWEALKDPELPHPLALAATVVRQNQTPRPLRAQAQVSPTINVLVVTARPGGGRDVGYRTTRGPWSRRYARPSCGLMSTSCAPASTRPCLTTCSRPRGTRGRGITMSSTLTPTARS